MSQNNQIINYLKHFSDATFPVAKQRERVTLFGSTSSLMNMGEATSSPSLGSLVFWEDANGTEHCGIAIAKNGFKVYSITQQKGLTQSRRMTSVTGMVINQEETEGFAAENVLAQELISAGIQPSYLRTMPAGATAQDLTFWTDFQPL